MARIDKQPLYVLGFAFSEDLKHVWLIRKQRPEWQRGLINGIGGKVEGLESPYEAMQREFKEEAGEHIVGWKQFAFMSAGKANIVCFAAIVPKDQRPQTMTDEFVIVLSVTDVNTDRALMIGNIPWLVHMALSCLRKEMQGFPILIKES